MPRCVILRHETPSDSDRLSHWDFMLEADGELLTWQWESMPPKQHRFRARQLDNHRLDYLTREGVLSENRGTVIRTDEGTYTPAIEKIATDFEIFLQLQQFSGTLIGKQVQGNQWLFEYQPLN